MTENNKPEWFEIVEADGPATPPKASKTLPVAALIVTALILGAGAVVGQVGQESPAIAMQDNLTATNSVNSPNGSPLSPDIAAATTRLANPSIAMLPTNGDDEDEDDGYEDEDDEDEYEDEDEEDDD